jgi:hypothetical protein
MRNLIAAAQKLGGIQKYGPRNARSALSARAKYRYGCWMVGFSRLGRAAFYS